MLNNIFVTNDYNNKILIKLIFKILKFNIYIYIYIYIFVNI